MLGVDHTELEQNIVPVFLVRDREPIAFCGTGFLLRDVFVTCWHCVEKTPEPDHTYIGAARVNGHFVPWPLLDLEQDANGSDLALARVDAAATLGITLSSEGRLLGHDVWTYGYPLTEPRREADGLHFTLHGRALRGYATRTFDYRHPRFGAVSSYELDMPAPAGLSGAPLLLSSTREVIGVVYGSHQVQVADAEEYGQQTERVSIASVTFSLAHRSKTLRAARAKATQQKTLAEYLEAK